LLDIIKELNIDLKQHYFRLGLYANSLLLNKKMYLLYNIWNKKRELCLIDKNKKNRISINFLTFTSLNVNFYSQKSIKFDYFMKWSSSKNYFNDLVMQDLVYDNRRKLFINTLKSLNYTIFDSIFSSYILNSKKAYYYYYKNKYLLDFFFKFTPKLEMQFEYFYFFNFYDKFCILNINYIDLIKNFFWKENNNVNLYNYIKKYIKNNIKQKLKKNILFYYTIKEKKYFFSLYLIKKLYKNIFLYNFLKNINKNKNMYIYLKNFLSLLYFRSGFNNIFFKYKKKKMYKFLQEKFLSFVGLNIYRNFKKKNFYTFLKKIKYKYNKLYNRNYYKFNNFNCLRLKKKLKNNLIYKKRNKITNKKILKKLKTFRYIPNKGTWTKQEVYSRFKSNVLKKFARKRSRKFKKICIGRRFHIYAHNSKKNYKNKIKAQKLRKRITPYYFFFEKKKENIYMDLSKYAKGVVSKEIPLHILLKIKKKRKKRIIDFNYDKKKKEKELRKILSFIYWRSFKKYEKNWINLYKNRGNLYRKLKFSKFVKLLKKKMFSKQLLKWKKKENIFKAEDDFVNIKFGKQYGKKDFWFFQKTIIFFKNMIKFKKRISFIYNDYTKYSFLKIKSFYKNFLFANITILNYIFIFNCKKKKKKLYKLLKSIKNWLYLFFLRFEFFLWYFKKFKNIKFLNFLKKIQKLKKRKKNFIKKRNITNFNLENKSIILSKSSEWDKEFTAVSNFDKLEYLTWKNRKEWKKKIKEIKNSLLLKNKEKQELKPLIDSINEKMKKSLYEYKVKQGYMQPNDKKTPYPNPPKSKLNQIKENFKFEYNHKLHLEKNNFRDKQIKNNYNYTNNNANKSK
jgi:hypothetical protein